VSDSYQAIYDAVRSRIGGGDIGSVVRDVLFQQFDISHQCAILQQEIFVVSHELQRPSVVMRPALTQDGDAWLAIYGDLPTGVVGTGKTPAEAMAAFDEAWSRPAATRQATGG
jgi:hypothetical protein